MTIQFNIIYTPGSVKPLSFFIWSLLEYSDFSFRLVSNGCLLAERTYLQCLCQQNSRLSYWAVPTTRMLPHGQVLNYLQALSQEDYFCFLDSDIFITGELETFLMPLKKGQHAIFSGLPLWVKHKEAAMPDDFQHMVGTFNRTDTKKIIGGTYVALYDNSFLTQIMQETAIGFDSYRFNDLPTVIQRQLIKLNMVKKSYDTGKVLNLLLLSAGGNLSNIVTPMLHHIGGTSFEVQAQQLQQTLKQKIANSIMQSPLKSLLLYRRNRRAKIDFSQRYESSPPAEISLNLQQRLQYRTPTRQYFLRLLNSLFLDQPQPLLPNILDEEIKSNVQQSSEALIMMFQRYKPHITNMDKLLALHNKGSK